MLEHRKNMLRVGEPTLRTSATVKGSQLRVQKSVTVSHAAFLSPPSPDFFNLVNIDLEPMIMKEEGIHLCWNSIDAGEKKES